MHVNTDHKPLVESHCIKYPIMSIQKYSLTVKYKSGKELFIADTLFREADELEFKQYNINEDDFVSYPCDLIETSTTNPNTNQGTGPLSPFH